MHAPQAIECARAGRHVVTEKPMATRYEDGQAMVRACLDANVGLFVVKQNRLNPTVRLVRHALDAGRFGRIFLCTVNVFWTRPQSYYDAAPWRGRWDLDGGAFMNQASHYVDLLDWLVGPVDNVHAYTATLARNIEAEDTGVMSLQLRGGGLASINVTMLTYPKNLEGSITILGERGSVRIGGTAVNKIEHWEFDSPAEDDEQVESASYDVASVYGPGHALYYDNLIAALRGQAPAKVNGQDGLRSLEVLVAAYRSAREGVRRATAVGDSVIHPSAIVDAGAQVGVGTKIWHFSHVCSGARVGADCSLGQGVFVSGAAVIGDRVKVQNNVSVFDAVTLEDDVFCGPSAVFTNVANPRAEVVRKGEYRSTLVRRGATLGANCTVICGVTIGRYAFVGAGAVVSRDVPDFALVVGVPARQIGWMSRRGERLDLPLQGAEAHARCPSSGEGYLLRNGRCELSEPEAL